MNKYIVKDLQELVRENIITGKTAEDISNYYRQKEAGSTSPLTLTLAILGALLVGSGIVLLVAHNWDELSKTIRTVLAFLPLALSQLLGLYTLLKRKQQQAWIESSAVFLFLSMGAAMALVSQIYQINGSLSTFLLTWTAVSIPLVYILSSSTLAILCISSLTWYACIVGYDGSLSAFPMLYLVGMFCLLPYYWMLIRQRPQSNFVVLLNWAFAISVAIVLPAFTRLSTYLSYEWLTLLYSTLFCLYIAIGRTGYFYNSHILKNAFLLIGLPGTLLILFTSSFSLLELTYGNETILVSRDPLPYVIVVITSLTVYLVYRIIRQDPGRLSPDIFAFIFLYLCMQFPANNTIPERIVINLLIIVIACYYIWKGAQVNNLPILNFGLVIFAILAICRFFDEQIPFLLRGLLFVAAGVGFFSANLFVIRKRKKLIA